MLSTKASLRMLSSLITLPSLSMTVLSGNLYKTFLPVDLSSSSSDFRSTPFKSDNLKGEASTGSLVPALSGEDHLNFLGSPPAST